MLVQPVGDPLVIAPILDCRDGWTQEGGVCYRLFTSPLPWAAAEAFCVAQGGHLAAVHNATQFDAINALGATYHFWLGGHAGEYGVPAGCDWNIWANADGSPWDYVNWDYNQPDHVHELCIEVRGDPVLSGGA